MIQLLTQERSQAEACIGLLKASSDNAAIAAAKVAYLTAKPETDGLIEGLKTALIQGGSPDSLPGVQASLEIAGKGLKEICDAAVKTIPPGGTKGVFEEMAKGAVEPLVTAISSGIGGLWKQHVEKDALKLEAIKTQLEAAKWPDFGEIAPAQ